MCVCVGVGVKRPWPYFRLCRCRCRRFRRLVRVLGPASFSFSFPLCLTSFVFRPWLCSCNFMRIITAHTHTHKHTEGEVRRVCLSDRQVDRLFFLAPLPPSVCLPRWQLPLLQGQVKSRASSTRLGCQARPQVGLGLGLVLGCGCGWQWAVGCGRWPGRRCDGEAGS